LHSAGPEFCGMRIVDVAGGGLRGLDFSGNRREATDQIVGSAGSPSECESLDAGIRAARIAAASSRARPIPAQACTPCPKAIWAEASWAAECVGVGQNPSNIVVSADREDIQPPQPDDGPSVAQRAEFVVEIQ
jgi:hypothetical protein